MAEELRIRLGAVEVVYDARHGLSLHDAHEGRIQLQICETDLPELIQFVCRHSPAAGDAIRLAAPHWQCSGINRHGDFMIRPRF